MSSNSGPKEQTSTNPPVLKRATLTVDLAALAANYRAIRDRALGADTAGVIKANGYGLGAREAAETLAAQGCDVFYVARVEEGMGVRREQKDASIFVFDGVLPRTEDELVEYELTPVVNSLEQLERWNGYGHRIQRRLACSLHIDTGMRRLGLPEAETARLVDQLSAFDAVEITQVISHLASADVSGSEQSRQQLKRFSEIRKQLPMGQASLANSAGIYLGPDYHFDLVRPGIALYGGKPLPESQEANPMKNVATLEAPIAQLREAEPGETVGYGATYTIDRPTIVATIPVGYADGFLRSSSSRGSVAVAGHMAPIIGRVSMDLITIDVSDVPSQVLYPGAPVEMLGEYCRVDDVAAVAGSIPHEFLTNLGHRFAVNYQRS